MKSFSDRISLAPMQSLLVLVLAGALFPSHTISQYHQYVDPLIGSEGDGNVFIGPSCPFGMVKPGPDINKNANSGYSPDMSKPVYGFSQVHAPGNHRRRVYLV